MSVNISGIEEVEAALRERLGAERMVGISDRALVKAADVFVKELSSQMSSFRDTGATVDEITISEPYEFGGKRTIKVHWKGPKNRYRIIHLNEYGTVHSPNPKGKGAIARALQSSESAYRSAVEQSLRGEF